LSRRAQPLQRVAQQTEIDRLRHRLADVELQRLGEARRLLGDRGVAAADDDGRRLAADRPKVAQYLDAGMGAERKIERDAVELAVAQ
jgi:hypothetical protein